MVRAIFGSVADLAIVPMQDLLGLGNDARMNLPATADGNWSWRLRDGEFSGDVAGRLKNLISIYGR
jgi:4-alpha-glucanotransferase